MPVVICLWCEYVGQDRGSTSGNTCRTFEAEIRDVEDHEKECPDNPDNK